MVPIGLSAIHTVHMRPEILFPLFKPVTSIKGVGARTADAISKIAGEHVVDLLWHLPSDLIDRRYEPKLAEAESGRIATIAITVGDHAPARNKRMPYRVHAFDETGELSLVFFHARPDFLKRTLPPGETRIISGRIESYGGDLQMTHPDYVLSASERDTLKLVEPVYPLTAGLSLKVLGKAIDAALAILPEVPEWLDNALVKRESWPTWRDAVLRAHAPYGPNDLSPDNPARQRLAYDELLANQLALGMVRARMKRLRGRPLIGNGRLRESVSEHLPFQLTASQRDAIDEIDRDLRSEHRMLRLLQGDVGAGKTIVALMTLLSAVEAGGQAVFMAPTDVLARQHFETLSALLDPVNVELALLTGRDRGKSREATLKMLSSGAAQIVIGTHALFQDDVTYNDLRLAVIDEQHRFGVHQRLTLAEKGKDVDVLVMTATPIPRTLMLTAYGDMDVSRLMEKPAGRQPVQTALISNDRMDEVIEGVGRALTGGARIYWICPLVEESEKTDMAAAEARFDHLSQVFGERVGLVHGRMRSAEKDAVMDAFRQGDKSVLVATTVVEVGVDVPEATVMVIEHAERFGLAQLHQLRGRIGRGAERSSCLLVHTGKLGETAKERLKTMRSTDDGFVIAEKDLELRGAGELLGTRQSGLPEFRLADLAHHTPLLQMARDDVELILSRDPELRDERGQALRVLMYLFERDSAIINLRSG